MSSSSKSLSDLDLRAALDWGLELRLWVATAVTSLSLYSARVLGLPRDSSTTTALAIVFFATLALYNLDGSLDSPPPTSDCPTARDRRPFHWALTGLSALALAILFTQLSLRAGLLICVGALLCSLYAVPWTLKAKQEAHSHRAPRLKAIPFLKAPFVGCAVGTAVVWVPIWISNQSPQLPLTLALQGALSVLCTANALLFDIADASEDRRAEVPTLPVRWGVKKTRWVTRALALSGLICAATFSLLGRDAYIGLYALGAVLFFAGQRVHVTTSRRKVSLLVDGALLLPLGFLLVRRAMSGG